MLLRNLLLDALMRPGLVEVEKRRMKHPMELLLLQDEQVIETLSTDTAHKPLTDRLGSRCMGRRGEHLVAEGCGHAREMRSTRVLTISKEIVRPLSIGSCLPALLGSPGVGRKARSPNVDDLARFQFKEKKRKERAEAQVSDGQAIAGPRPPRSAQHECAASSPNFALWSQAYAHAAWTSEAFVCRRRSPASATRHGSVPLRRRRLVLAISCIKDIVSAATFACGDLAFDLCLHKRRASLTMPPEKRLGLNNSSRACLQVRTAGSRQKHEQDAIAWPEAWPFDLSAKKKELWS